MKLPASGNCARCGALSLTVNPVLPACGSERPNSAARSGRPPKWISSTIAGTAIAKTLIQNWKACT